MCDWLVELDALLGIFCCMFNSSFRDTQALSSDTDTTDIQIRHGNFKTVALFPKQLFLGHLTLIKTQLNRIGSMQTHFMLWFADIKPRCILFQNKCTDAFRAFSL